jgi:protein phosphatase 1 regulatory subunit 7
MEKRITNPADLADAKAFIANGDSVIVQFSNPNYTHQVLKELDAIALYHGNQIQIRFYGHYQSTFDFNVLKFIPNVSNLSVDGLSKAANFAALQDIRSLSRLHIGVDNELPSDLLSYQSFSSLEALGVGPCNQKNLDLSHLIKYKRLKDLFLVGHTKNIESIRSLKSLEKLGLSQIGKTQSLSFINELSSLKSLMIILGGRSNINEVVSLSLESIEIIRIRGLQEFNASRFPNLRRLRIEDQIQIQELSFSNESSDLELISIVNCKALEEVYGLKYLESLESIHFSRTGLDIDALISQGFPQSLREVYFYTNSNKTNKEIYQRLTALGYKSRSVG